MLRSSDGCRWTVTVPLSVGKHLYAFSDGSLGEFLARDFPMDSGRHVLPAAELETCAALLGEGPSPLYIVQSPPSCLTRTSTCSVATDAHFERPARRNA
jgi:hypothetical protein